jgi:hypothetical protein
MGVTKLGKPDPRSLMAAVAKETGEEKYLDYKELFYSQYWSPKSTLGKFKWKMTGYLLPPKRSDSSICTPFRYAVAYSGYNYLILCHDYFDEKGLVWAKNHVGDRDIKSLDDLKTRAGTLVHEIMHMANRKGKWKMNKGKERKCKTGLC